MDDITFDVPNLDCESIDPADYERLAKVLTLLANYSTNKAAAMRFRLAGYVNSALKVEAENDRLYRQLPEWARW